MTICACKCFFQQRGDCTLKEGGGGQGVEVLGEHATATKSFLCLKTQLHSLCLALVSQVQWKFVTEAFIPENMTEGDVNERPWNTVMSIGTRANAEECSIIDATQHVDPFVPKIKTKKRKKNWLGFILFIIDHLLLRCRNRPNVWLDWEDYLV